MVTPLSLLRRSWPLLLLALPLIVRADAEFAEVYKLPATIQEVDKLCPWKSPRAEGYIRVIRTQQPDRHFLYLQWVEKGAEANTDTVTATRMVEELAGDLALHMERPLASLHADRCELNIRAQSVDKERGYRLQITLKGPGDYQLAVIESLPGDH